MCFSYNQLHAVSRASICTIATSNSTTTLYVVEEGTLFRLFVISWQILHLIDCFRLFIVVTGCNAPRGRLVVTGDSARIQDETSENSAWFFNVLGV